MRCYLGLLLLGCGAGCQSLVTSENRELTGQEQAYLKASAQPPESLGIELVKHGQSISARWHETVDIGEPVTAPLLPPDFYRSAQPVVVGTLNGGRPVALVLDTGAPVNLVHAAVARANRVRIADPRRVTDLYRGLDGSERAYYGMIDRFTVGPLHFRHVFTAVRTRVYLRKFFGALPVFRWEGNLIGMTTLTRLSYLTLDYPRSRATFAAREFFSATNGPTACGIPFRLDSMQMFVGLRIGGQETAPALIDTGNDAGLMLPDRVVRQLGFAELAADGKRGKYVGLGGEMATRTFTVPAMELGGATFTNVITVAVPGDYPVTVGSGFLKAYKVTFDFRRKMLWLEK